MDIRREDTADGGGNQSYTLINLCESDQPDVKRLQRYALAPFEDQSGMLVKASRLSNARSLW